MFTDTQAASRPNLVYILADDMGYGDVSCLNPDSKIHTASIDRLAERGVRFTDAHASSAVCTPSRYSILTGRYAWRSRLKHGVTFGYTRHLIEDDRITVAEYLRRQGYQTACVGKWHLGMDWHDKAGNKTDDPEAVDFSKPIANGPTRFGFDHYFGISASLDMPPYVYIEDDRVTALPTRESESPTLKELWRKGPTAPDFYHIDVLPTLTRKAEEFIERASSRASSRGAPGAAGEAGHGGFPGGASEARDGVGPRAAAPYFLYFPLPAPHTPILPTAEFRGKSGLNTYGDFCLQVDAVVGRIMAAVEASGQADNTIVVFTSDNGCSPWVDFAELNGLGHNPSYVFRGHKADIYDGGHRIPLVVSWPNTIPAGSESDQLVCLSDLFATMIEITGGSTVAGGEAAADSGTYAEDSVSNLPIWRGVAGGRAESPVREAIVHHSINGSFSIRRGRWKLELCPGSGGWSDPKPGEEPAGSPPIQLYDMDADVGEQKNVHGEHPEIVAELTALLTDYLRRGRSTPGAPQKNESVDEWPGLNWDGAIAAAAGGN